MPAGQHALDRKEITLQYYQVRPGVLVELSWRRVRINGVDYFEPSPCGAQFRTTNGLRERGVYVGQEVHEQAAPALPLKTGTGRSQVAVWQYGAAL